MYESPIKLFFPRFDEEICNIAKKQDEMVFEAVAKVGVTVDRDELIRALKYDRGQYDKGFADGKRAAMDELIRCAKCKHGEFEQENGMWACVRCADYDADFDMFTGFIEYHNENHFCSYGERRSDD